MDPKFGSELVTNKGKIFKFDDISCMIKYMKMNVENSIEYQHIVVNQYDKPTELIETSNGFFLTSPKYQSPMMGNTASFADLKVVDRLIETDTEAKKHTWEKLLNTLK